MPRSWIEKFLETFKISPVLRNFLSQSMRMWKTISVLSNVENTFQGDSLSPILFCVTLIPLSKLLNNTGYDYKIYDNTINHLFYMGNRQLFAKNGQQRQGLLNSLVMIFEWNLE